MDLELPAVSKPSHRYRRKAPQVSADPAPRPEKHPRQLKKKWVTEASLLCLKHIIFLANFRKQLFVDRDRPAFRKSYEKETLDPRSRVLHSWTSEKEPH